MGILEKLFGRRNIRKLTAKADVEGTANAPGHEEASLRAKRSKLPQDIKVVEPIDRWIEDLRHDDWNIRKDAERALIRCGRASLQALISALDASSDRTVAHAASALGEIGDAAALEPLIAAWKKTFFSFDVARALSRLDLESVGMGDKVRILLMAGEWHRIPKYGTATVEPLIASLGDKHAQVRQDAICALGSLPLR